MRHTMIAAALLAAFVLRVAAADAAEPPAACKATPENAAYQLEKAAGDASQALQDWLRYCPNDELMVEYAAAIRNAKAAPAAKSPPKPAATTTPAPVTPVTTTPTAAQRKSEPYGTFAGTGRMTYDDQSGYDEWDDWLTIREDGTAELLSKYKVNLSPTWSLKGCDNGKRQGFAQIVQRYKVTVDGSTVTLTRDGPMQISRQEPSCWTYSWDGFLVDEWNLDWKYGRLKDKNGEYFRQD